MIKLIFRLFSNVLSKKNVYIIKSLSYKKRQQLLPVNYDYVRYSSLVLCHEEITRKNLPGSIAEVGVYRGDFAKRLNILFPEKKLYLFDTFEGFVGPDIDFENTNRYSSATQDFSKTSIGLVSSKMLHPMNCIFKKGYFPETAKDIDDIFCFVSLDADLFVPTYEGLKYFYPRLVTGGFIFIHDFNNSEYPGARDAVIQFCKENSTGYVPIPDSGGTAIITK